MTDLTPHTAPRLQTVVRHGEGTEMLLHEALARCRHQEALEAARQQALVRQFTAGRRWASLAGFAARRAERARSAAASQVRLA